MWKESLYGIERNGGSDIGEHESVVWSESTEESVRSKDKKDKAKKVVKVFIFVPNRTLTKKESTL